MWDIKGHAGQISGVTKGEPLGVMYFPSVGTENDGEVEGQSQFHRQKIG